MIENETTFPTADEEILAVIDPAEGQLTNEVGELWQIHNQANTSLHQTRDELKRIRTDLSQRLHALKAVLSRPGRGGAWHGFLLSQNIPRATADRLVRAHKQMISADPGSCAGEQILEPGEDIRRYVKGIWPRLSKLLTNREAVEVFVRELHRVAEKSFADKRSASSLAKSSEIPSYLRHLNLPVIHRAPVAA